MKLMLICLMTSRQSSYIRRRQPGWYNRLSLSAWQWLATAAGGQAAGGRWRPAGCLWLAGKLIAIEGRRTGETYRSGGHAFSG